jgi:hypothetical protein
LLDWRPVLLVPRDTARNCCCCGCDRRFSVASEARVLTPPEAVLLPPLPERKRPNRPRLLERFSAAAAAPVDAVAALLSSRLSRVDPPPPPLAPKAFRLEARPGVR